MVAIQFRMDVGYPGAINRAHDATITSLPIGTAPPAGYGVMTAFDTVPISGAARAVVSTDTLVNFAGFYVRPFPTHGEGTSGTTMVNDPLGTSTPPTTGLANLMKRGFMTVKLNAASPAVKRGDPIGIFIGTATTGNPAGGVTGAAPLAGSVIQLNLPNTFFMGPADAKGIVEIAYNL
jgi:hypothetical protein